MEWLLILTAKYFGESVSVTAVNTPSVKSCVKAGESWKKNTENDLNYIEVSFTCSPMQKGTK